MVSKINQSYEQTNNLTGNIARGTNGGNKFLASLEDAVYNAYAQLLFERRQRGDLSTSFSRRDYMKYKRPQDPSTSTIERSLGGWANVAKLLPIEDTNNMRHLRSAKLQSRDDLGYERFYSILEDIALSVGKESPLFVSSREYKAYAKEHLVADWRTFAGRMETSTWNDTVRFAYKKHFEKKGRKR